MRIINELTTAYKTRARNDLLAHIPSPDDVSPKYITYEYFRANGTLIRSETVTDGELTKEEIWETLQLCGASRVRWISECGIIPLVLSTVDEFGEDV